MIVLSRRLFSVEHNLVQKLSRLLSKERELNKIRVSSESKLNLPLSFIQPKTTLKSKESITPVEFKMSTWHVLNYSKEEITKAAGEPVDKRVSVQVLKRCLNIQKF